MNGFWRARRTLIQSSAHDDLTKQMSGLIRIKNAREAMKAGDPNVLRFSVEKVRSLVRFEVSDTGHGIKSDVLPKIFEPFVTHGKSNGTGLGLAISKAVVEAHGGTIGVQSSEAGTTFRVELPLPAEKES